MIIRPLSRLAVLSLALMLSAQSMAAFHAWTIALQMTYWQYETDVVKDEENLDPDPETKTGYAGFKNRINQCVGATIAPDPDHPGPAWSTRLQTLYGPNEVRVNYSYMPTYEIPGMTRRYHHVDWTIENYGEVWFHDTNNLNLTGDPAQDWIILMGWATGPTPNMAARAETINRGNNIVDMIPIPPLPPGDPF